MILDSAAQGAMTSTHQRLLLSSLGYSSLDKLDLSTAKNFRHVVAWLEHTKVPTSSIWPLGLT